MKKFKRLAALLLAGLMMLAAFTACSSEDVVQLSLGERYVQTYIEGINNVRSEGMPELENDPELKKYCEQVLAQIDADGYYDADLEYIAYLDGIELIIETDGFAEAPDGKVKAAPLTEDLLAALWGQYNDNSNPDFGNGYDLYTAIGVAYLEVDGVIYGATARTTR